MSITPSPGGPGLSKERPKWPEQVRKPEELEIGELFEVWHRGEHGDELEYIFQVAGEPERDKIGTKIKVIKMSYQHDPDLNPEREIYLEDHSVIPNEVGLWNKANHLKRHPSHAYKELCKQGI